MLENKIGLVAAVFVTTHAVHQGNQGQEHRDNDAADDHGQKDDHDGFQQRSHGGHRVIHFFVVVVGDFQQHFGQRAGLLTDVHHADHHGRKHFGSFQRRRDGFAFFHTVMNRLHGAAHDDVARSFFNNGERLQNRNTAAD